MRFRCEILKRGAVPAKIDGTIGSQCGWIWTNYSRVCRTRVGIQSADDPYEFRLCACTTTRNDSRPVGISKVVRACPSASVTSAGCQYTVVAGEPSRDERRV